MNRTAYRIGSWKLPAPLNLRVCGDTEEFLWHEIIVSDTYGLGALAESGLSPEVIWDVGASVGYFSAAVLAIWPRAGVYGWEPFSVAADLARCNAPKAIIRTAAAGTQAGSATLLRWDLPVGHAGSMLDTLPPENRDVREGEPVRESVNVEVPWQSAPPPDLLKLDCEGAEWALLAELPSQPVVIIGEGHGSDKTSRRIKERLDELCPAYDWRVFPWNSQFHGRRRNGVPRFVTAV